MTSTKVGVGETQILSPLLTITPSPSVCPLQLFVSISVKTRVLSVFLILTLLLHRSEAFVPISCVNNYVCNRVDTPIEELESCVFQTEGEKDLENTSLRQKIQKYLQHLRFPQCRISQAKCSKNENHITTNLIHRKAFLTTQEMAEAKSHEEIITDQKVDLNKKKDKENGGSEKVGSTEDDGMNDVQEFDTDDNGEQSSDEWKQSEPTKKKKKQSSIKKFFTRGEAKKNEEKIKNDRSKLSKWSLSKRHSDADTQAYREGYPGKRDDPQITANIDFYQGRIQSTPDGAFIDDLHEHWWGDYHRLERHHGYIQWIFPIREEGMNWQAQPLQLHEAKAIMKDKTAMKRVLKSYKMMLDFYGMELIDDKTGEIERAENWKERFNHLSWSFHNYLRITRMLKCLGELGLEHLKKPFLQFMLNEALITGALVKVLTSCRDYWIGTLKSDDDREELYRFIETNS